MGGVARGVARGERERDQRVRVHKSYVRTYIYIRVWSSSECTYGSFEWTEDSYEGLEERRSSCIVLLVRSGFA